MGLEIEITERLLKICVNFVSMQCKIHTLEELSIQNNISVTYNRTLGIKEQ